MPKVYNRHHRNDPDDAIYIGRPSNWGNPFVIEVGRTRAEAVAMFETYLLSQPDLIDSVREELRGKDLVCFCAPHACHGDVLLRIANGED